MLVKVAATVIAGFIATGVAFAQSTSKVPQDRAARMDRHFAYTDKNNDGYIARDEVAPYPVLVKHFPIIDFNKDGRISKDEMRAYRLGTHRKRRPANQEAKTKAPAVNSQGDALSQADNDPGSISRKN